MSDDFTPTNLPLGYVTEAQLLAMPAFNIPYVNRAGIPNTNTGSKYRVNGVWGDQQVLFWVQVNNILNGSVPLPPGLALASGKSWRQGDDGANIIETNDLTAYGIQAPSALWHLNGTNAAYISFNTLVNSDVVRIPCFELVDARGGVNGEARFIYAGRSMYGLHRYSSTSIAGIGATMAFGMFVTLSNWNQAPNGVVLATYRRYDSASETGVSDNLGFELGLGYDTASSSGDELALYYRHRNAAGVDVIRFPTTSGARIAMPFGREMFIAFVRTATTIDFYVNGLLLSSSTFSGPDAPSIGTSPAMRLVLGSAWDGTRYLNGSCRSVGIWTGTQPTAANLLSYYRVGAGFLPKAIPA